jgi:hypothetical protein
LVIGIETIGNGTSIAERANRETKNQGTVRTGSQIEGGTP